MTEVVHVITTLGPTDGSGLLVSAQLFAPGSFEETTFRVQQAYRRYFDEAIRRDFDTSVFAVQADPCPYPNCISRRGHRGRHPIVRPSQDTTETL